MGKNARHHPPLPHSARSMNRRQFVQASFGVAAASTLLTLPSLEGAAPLRASWASHYTYVAPDLGKTRDWYHEVFGMQVAHSNAREAHLWYGDDGGDTMMIIRQAAAGEAAPRIERFAFTIEGWDRGAVEAELNRRGARPKADGDLGFWFTDPDGNEVGVFAANYLTRPTPGPERPELWKAVSANHIVLTSRNYRGLGDWYRDLLSLRETLDGGRDVYQWFGDSVWIPTSVREGAKTSVELKSLDHVALSIDEYNSADVEAELKRRKMIEADAAVSGSLGIYSQDINGYKIQVCDRNLVPDAESRRRG